MSTNKLNIKRIVSNIVWCCLAIAAIILTVAAIQRQDAMVCKGIDIEITGVSNNFFIDQNDVLKIIEDFTGNKSTGVAISKFNLQQIEAAIEKDVWVDNAELYFDKNGLLKVFVEEREPIARIFTNSGNTFYIDSAIMMLPLSEKFSARLPVFTGFTTDAKVLAKEDSTLLFDIKKISIAIQTDSFLMAMIDQVDITNSRVFEIVPKIGNQQIIFGDASDINEKFAKLKLFYKKVMVNAGWNKYSVIDLQYKEQVVAKIAGKADIAKDSVRTLQLMENMAKYAAMAASDSVRIAAPGNDNLGVDNSLIDQSVEREEESNSDNYEASKAATFTNEKPVKVINEPKPTTEKIVVAPKKESKIVAKEKPVVKKEEPKKETKAAVKKETPKVKEQPKPKAVMPKNNDY